MKEYDQIAQMRTYQEPGIIKQAPNIPKYVIINGVVERVGEGTFKGLENVIRKTEEYQ